MYPLVHPAILVESYEHGENVSHYVDDLKWQKRVKSALAHIRTHAFLKMLPVCNFIHAYTHPGNIVVRVTQSNSRRKWLFTSKPHVIFLDVGMTAELSKSDQVNLLGFFKAVADQVSSWKSSRGMTDEVDIDHNCCEVICTYYWIGVVFVCEKTGRVHVCDDTCKVVVTYTTNDIVVCTISGHCFDR